MNAHHMQIEAADREPDDVTDEAFELDEEGVRRVSQTKAAHLAGVSRGTIANRIDAGRLSCSADGIDPAELVRVFPDIDEARVNHFVETGEMPDETVGNGASALRLRVATLEQEQRKLVAEVGRYEEALKRSRKLAKQLHRWLKEAGE